ncbi:MAG: TrkA family potassium uptake protein [Chloroflexi bacterium]|nr:TrkA family potassium uptake protein [Chloroflexota bacterium]
MKIIIIGCGRLGSGLAQTLNLRGHTIIAVDNDPAAFERLGPGFKGQTIMGVGFDRDVLLKAGIARADGLAAVTTSDEVNLVAARMASQFFRVPRVVARVYDPQKAEIYWRLGLQTITPITWGINRIAELLTFFPLHPTLSLGQGGVDLVEAEIPPLLIGRPVQEVTIPGEIHVVAISRGSQTFLPTLGTVFQAGDLIHFAILAASADRLKAILALG